ncbi:MAG TPA: HD domain-containing protein [Syntrophales bacterium]|nr:HD domain-containing protein [Syntrophales bacterium]
MTGRTKITAAFAVVAASACAIFFGFLLKEHGGLIFLIALVALSAALCAGAALPACRRRGSRPEPEKSPHACARKEIPLAELAAIWRPSGKGSFSPDSRQETGAMKIAEKTDRAIFRNASIRKFFEENIGNDCFFPRQAASRAVVLELLSVLDLHGDCPSVVDCDMRFVSGKKESDAERRRAGGGRTVFEILSGTSLRDHSLAVAEASVRRCGIGSGAPLIIISALAHDLGKLPHYREKPSFHSIDHARSSALILKGMPSFSLLPSGMAREIEDAVANHHRHRPGALAETLQKADAECREKEIAAARTGQPC